MDGVRKKWSFETYHGIYYNYNVDIFAIISYNSSLLTGKLYFTYHS